jgi:hypothetical protein
MTNSSLLDPMFHGQEIVVYETPDAYPVWMDRDQIKFTQHTKKPEYFKAIWYRYVSSIMENQQLHGYVHDARWTSPDRLFVLAGIKERENGSGHPDAPWVFLSWDSVVSISRDLSKSSLYYTQLPRVIWRGIASEGLDLETSLSDTDRLVRKTVRVTRQYNEKEIASSIVIR